jgi:hypothetical protein
MTSLQTNTRQNHNDLGYFINVGSLVNKVSAYNPTTGLVSTAAWCAAPLQSSVSTLATAGGFVLRDMGRTFVSSNRTFRKVQAQVAAFPSTNGVGGSVQTAAGEDYFTGFIELGFEGAGQAAPVARFGR